MPPKAPAPAAKPAAKQAAPAAAKPAAKQAAPAAAAAAADKGKKADAPKQAAAAKQAPAAAAGKKQVAPAPAAKQQAAPAPAAKEPTKKGDTAGVYVKGIGAGDDLDTLKKVFRSAGNIIAARRRSDKYCIFWYDSQSSAKKAIESFHNKQVHGSKVSVVAAKSAPPRDRADYCKTVFISNVSPSTSRTQLRQALSAYGEISKIRVYTTGFAFVYFNDVKSAVKCRNELNGKKFMNRFVNVKLSVRTKDADAKREKSARKRSRVWADRRKWVMKIGH